MSNIFYSKIKGQLEEINTSNIEDTIKLKYQSTTPANKESSRSSSKKHQRSLSTKFSSPAIGLKKANSSTIEVSQEGSSPKRQLNTYQSRIARIQELEVELDEEKTKNTSYLKEIMRLNEKIEELEKKSNTKHICNTKCSHGCKENEVEVILKENQDLRLFKENVFEISKKYDDINQNVITSLQEIDQLFTKFNQTKLRMTYTKKALGLESAKTSFENVMNTLIEMMREKQEEYNFLLKSREKELFDIRIERESLINRVYSLEDSLHNYHCHSKHYATYGCQHNSQSCHIIEDDVCNSTKEKEYIYSKRVRPSHSSSYGGR